MLAAPWGQSKTLHPHTSNFLQILHPSTCLPLPPTPTREPPTHRPGCWFQLSCDSPGGLGAGLWDERSPSPASSPKTGPAQPLRGANRPGARTWRTHRAIPEFAPSWQPPFRNRCQAAKATCYWGGQGPHSQLQRTGKGEARWRYLLPQPGRPGQPGGCTLGVREPSPGYGKPPPCSPQGSLLGQIVFLIQQVCFSRILGATVSGLGLQPGVGHPGV